MVIQSQGDAGQIEKKAKLSSARGTRAIKRVVTDAMPKPFLFRMNLEEAFSRHSYVTFSPPAPFRYT